MNLCSDAVTLITMFVEIVLLIIFSQPEQDTILNFIYLHSFRADSEDTTVILVSFVLCRLMQTWYLDFNSQAIYLLLCWNYKFIRKRNPPEYQMRLLNFTIFLVKILVLVWFVTKLGIYQRQFEILGKIKCLFCNIIPASDMWGD